MTDEVKGEMPEKTAADAAETTIEKPKVETTEELKAELDKVAKALKDANKEAAERRKKLEAYEKADEERKQAAMTELDKTKAELEKAQKQIAEQEHSQQKRAAAAKVGLPDILADRVIGSTPEELEADAIKLLDGLPKAKPAGNVLNPPEGAKQAETDAQRRARLGI